MPRTARLDAPDVLHHVMIRGIERRKISRNDKDCEDFIERLETARELGMSLTELTMKLEMSIAGVGFAVKRGELIAKKRDFMLIS